MMKTIKNSVLLLALVFASGSLMASGGMSVKLTSMNNDKAFVEISNTAQNNFEIEIRNANNDVVYFNETKSPQNAYAKIYDFSGLSDGDYTFSVKNDKVKYEKELEVDNGSVRVASVKKSMDPYFSYDNQNLKFSFLNFEQDDVKLYLYENRTNRMVYSTNLGSNFNITSGLDLSKLNNGMYQVVLASGDYVHSHDLHID